VVWDSCFASYVKKSPSVPLFKGGSLSSYIAIPYRGVPLNLPLWKRGLGGFKSPMLRYKQHLKNKARHLRKNLTDSERVLWSRLRGKQLYGIHVYRQKPIGDYIVDFLYQKPNLLA